MRSYCAKGLMYLNLKTLISFLDDPKDGDNRHASAIIGIIGEDMNAAVFAHYLKNLKRDEAWDVAVSIDSPVQGIRNGKWLDRWIQAINSKTGETILYQSEIKNWAASAIGGRRAPLSSDEGALQGIAEWYWNRGLINLFMLKNSPMALQRFCYP